MTPITSCSARATGRSGRPTSTSSSRTLPHAHIVNGTRIVEQLREYHTQLSTPMSYGNFFVGKLLELKHLGQGTFTDVGTTYKVIRRDTLAALLPHLDPAVNLEFNAHFLDQALTERIPIVECPITFHARVGTEQGRQRQQPTRRPGGCADDRRPLLRMALAPMSSTRERRVVYAAVVLIVLFRSALFTFTELSFDSDQAVIGLMAKHIAQGRAFPLFMYGQNYMLGVESWMAAPLFMLFGVSVAALKFPILLVNLAVALLAVRLLERDCGMRPALALLAAIFIVLPPAGTIGTLQEASGGTVEPLLYLLLLWIARRRPVVFGGIAAFGVIHREFTIYGVGVIIGMAVLEGAWRRRDGWLAFGKGLLSALVVWMAVHVLRPFSTALRPGTGAVIPGQPPNSVAEILNRVCFDASTIGSGFKALVAQHWGLLFGTTVMPLKGFGLESAVSQGVPWSGTVLRVSARSS